MTAWSEEEVEYLRLNYPTEPNEVLEDELGRGKSSIRKKAERIGVQRHPQFRLMKSVREAPKPNFPDEDFNNYIVGLVDGEGTFTTKGESQHRFGIELVEDDRGILEEMHDYLNVGFITELNSTEDHHSDTVVYTVTNFGELVCVIIPFFQEYQPRAKQKKFDFDYWSADILSRPDFRVERFK